jgi:hypothetical protein
MTSHWLLGTSEAGAFPQLGQVSSGAGVLAPEGGSILPEIVGKTKGKWPVFAICWL